MRSIGVLFLPLFLLGTNPISAAVTLLNLEIDTTSTTTQEPAVETGADGSFVIVWVADLSPGDDDSGTSIQAQVFSPCAAPALGPEEIRDEESNGFFGAEKLTSPGEACLPSTSRFQANAFTFGDQASPAVARAASGQFLVAWESPMQDGDGGAVVVRAFDSDGVALGSEILANTYTTGDQEQPAVGTDGSSFLVVWRSEGQDGDQGGIFRQAFDLDGAKVGAELAVGGTTAGDQGYPDLAFDGTDFLVVWESQETTEGDEGPPIYDIRGSRFTLSESAGTDYLVDPTSAGDQRRPAVGGTVDGGGAHIVVWQDQASTKGPPIYDIRGRRLNGTEGGEEFTVTGGASGSKEDPDTAVNAAGEFVVVWRDSQLLQSRLFDTPTSGGPEVGIGNIDSSDAPSVGFDAGGRSIAGRTTAPGLVRVRFSESLIYYDGFESGDTALWSSTQ